MDPWVVSEVLQPNLEWTGFSNVSVIHTIRVERFLEQAEQSSGTHVALPAISSLQSLSTLTRTINLSKGLALLITIPFSYNRQ